MAPGLLWFRKPAIDPTMSDEALVALARHDRQAFGILYDRYIDLVYRYCLVRLRDREEAEDVTSLVFARALAGIGNQRGASFRSWLFSIAHNAVADVYRSSGMSAPLAQIAADGGILAAGAAPDKHADSCLTKYASPLG